MTAMDLEPIKARLAAATPGPWLLGWWSGQAEAKCDCSRKGPLLGKRPQNQYPGAGPFHVHETDFFPDPHRLSGPPPECVDVAGNYDYETGGILDEADSAFIAAAREDVPALVAEVERLREALESAAQSFDAYRMVGAAEAARAGEVLTWPGKETRPAPAPPLTT